MRTPEELAAEARMLLVEQGKVDPAERFTVMVQTGLIDSEGRLRAEGPAPGPGPTALVDPAAARAYRLLHAEIAIIDALAPLRPDVRSRILEAVAILNGFDDLAAEIRAARGRPA